MNLCFGLEKLDNGRIRLHTRTYKNPMEKFKALRASGVTFFKVMPLGIVTDAQKRIFDGYEKP